MLRICFFFKLLGLGMLVSFILTKKNSVFEQNRFSFDDVTYVVFEQKAHSFTKIR